MDQLPRLGKRELICLLSFTCNYVVFVWRGFLFLWVLGMGYVILLWHSLSLPYNYFVKIGKQNFRSLVDSGAEVSLIHSRAYQNLKDKPKLMNKKVYLQSASGQPMMVDGSINVTLDIRGVKINQTLYVVRNLNRSLILGRDWLKTNGVRLYYDLGCLIIGHTYIPLEEDIHISTVVRIASTVTLRPQTANVCTGHFRHKSEAFESGIFEMSSMRMGMLELSQGL